MTSNISFDRLDYKMNVPPQQYDPISLNEVAFDSTIVSGTTSGSQLPMPAGIIPSISGIDSAQLDTIMNGYNVDWVSPRASRRYACLHLGRVCATH
jgi:hypothetical protein